MKIKRWIVLGFFLMKSIAGLAQGEGMEYSYLSDLKSFSKVSIDTLWDYFPEGRVDIKNIDSIKTWTKANTVSMTDSKGKPLAWSGLGWFQQKFTVHDSLDGKLIALMIAHFGASEVYLDGKLIGRFGDVFAKSGKGASFVPLKPFTAMLSNEQIHVLRIRYASHKFDKVIQPKLLFGFDLTIAPISESYPETTLTDYHGLFSLSLYISFTVLFFFLFLFYPQRLASLFTSFYLLNFSILFSTILVATTTNDASTFTWANLLWKSAVSFVGSLFLLFIYSLYYTKIPKRIWIVVLLMIIKIFVIFNPSFDSPIFQFIEILINIETWRIIIIGIRDKRVGFWLMAIGQFLGTLFFLLFIADVFHLFSPFFSSFSILREIGGLLSDLSAPMMFSLQLAWEFGSSNRNLKEQLTEVQKLSKENLEQEKEKQHILANHNDELEQQVKERTTELQESLSSLKATQTQLIQKEKLASLGELTAGIAHEIQNPLNFVNNFSEVSVELANELCEALRQRGIEANSNEGELVSDLIQNQEKIHHHGKRASSIVKGMLEHSRTSTGEKELTDINALADEYLRLAYHGLRAKDNTFNSDIKTDFDENLPKIEVIPQDFGRVLLNLINNAFYATKGVKNPLVEIKTERVENGVIVSVKDNGSGMSETTKAKIFQPFFTTKPTGEGTGLGLSLAYDIITKGHGGTLEVNSTEGDGSEFIIVLPIKTV